MFGKYSLPLQIIQVKSYAMMAQLVEQRIRNAWVAGSSPARGSLVFIDDPS